MGKPVRNAVLLIVAGLMLEQVDNCGADETRYVTRNGVTYQETVRNVPETVVQYERQKQTRSSLVPEYVTEFREQTEIRTRPIIRYRYEPRWHNVLNPFRPAHMAYHLIPYTSWETSTEQVKRPVTTRRLVSETTTVNVDVPRQRVINREVVVSRRAVATPASVAAAPRSVAPTQLAPSTTSSYAPAYASSYNQRDYSSGGWVSRPNTVNVPQSSDFRRQGLPATVLR